MLDRRFVALALLALPFAGLPIGAAVLAQEDRPAGGGAPGAGSEVPPRERPRPADARALFALFASSPGVEARFEEEKHLALLAVPLRSSGRFYFLPPGYLTRKIEQPEPSLVRVTPRELYSLSRGVEERVDLTRSADLAEFVGSLSSVLAGRRDGLAARWTIDYQHAVDDPAGWSLKLAPRTDIEGHEALESMVDSLVLTGAGQAVLQFEVREPSGDRTVTRVIESNPWRVFDAAEREALFGIPAPAED